MLPRVVSPELIRRFGQGGPRYTSYPTADRFMANESDAGLVSQLRLRAPARPLSLYVHIPFCESVCYYCACNKVVTRDHRRSKPYLAALQREMAMYAALLGAAQELTQIHLGGGTPTFLADDEIDGLMAAVRQCFQVRPDAEISIEVDPRTVTPQRLLHLARLGFSRISFGVQDFNPRVQAAVHRVQPHDEVCELMQAARDVGFASINVDLIYGLPQQTPASFAATIQQVVALRPDRVAMYAYAHLPERFKPQRRIHADDLPTPDARIEMLSDAIDCFLMQGYDYIGMDHFALAGDALAVAKRQGRLHRNFQGYSTQPDCDLIGLGVSAIGQMRDGYTQNTKTLPEYLARVEGGALPVARGLMLDAHDRLCRQVIMAVMCQGRVEFDAIGRAHGLDLRRHFSDEWPALERLAEQGLIKLSAAALQVTSTGWFFVRAVAMVFDRHLQTDRSAVGYSRIA